MSTVYIDGIQYIPKADTLPLTDERLWTAIEELVSIQYFKDEHKAIAHAWDVLNTLSPDLAKLAADDPKAAYDRVNTVWEKLMEQGQIYIVLFFSGLLVIAIFIETDKRRLFYYLKDLIVPIFCKHKPSPFVALNNPDGKVCEKCGKNYY